MSLHEAKIKEALLHPDPAVRWEAINYFGESYRSDAEVMPLVIQAVERYGRHTFVKGPFRLSRLPQTEATLDWVIAELGRPGRRVQAPDHFGLALSGVVARGDLTLLAPRAEEIQRVLADEPDWLASVRKRFDLMSWEVDRCWQELDDLAEHAATPTKEQLDFPHMGRVAEALARRGGAAVESRVLERIAVPMPNFEGQADGRYYRTLFAVAVAGYLRLPAAVSLIVDQLVGKEGEYLCDEAVPALARIGTPSVVEALAARWSEGNYSYQLSTSGVLDSIHNEECFCLEKVPVVEDPDIQDFFVVSLLGQLRTEVVEPLRQFVLKEGLDAVPDDVPGRLAAVATLLGVTFPEQEEWKLHGEKLEVERQERFHKFDELLKTPPATYRAASPKAPVPPPPRLTPIVRVDKKNVGRNDPCPCGSGKKFKKCCIDKA